MGIVIVVGIITLVVISIITIKQIKKIRNKKMQLEYAEKKQILDEVLVLDEEIEDAFKRMIKISKTKEAQELLEIWKKEYYSYSDYIVDEKELLENMAYDMEFNKYKSFKESSTSFEDSYSLSIEGIKDIHKKLYSYTNYELKNTSIALEIKEKVKELRNEAEIHLVNYKNYNQIPLELNEITKQLSIFEEKQKAGKYKEAREILKASNEALNNLIANFEYIINLIDIKSSFESEVEVINDAKEEIEKIGYKLQIDEEIEQLELIMHTIEKIENEITAFNFNKKVEVETKERIDGYIELIDSLVVKVKDVLIGEYEKIKNLIDIIKEVEELKEKCGTLIDGAKEEYEEIKTLYNINNINKIDRLEKEIENFEMFKIDYEKLMEFINESRDDYSTLIEKLKQSSSFVQKIMSKVKKVLLQIKDIREDEIKVREKMEENKKDITKITLYIKHYNHYYEMSNNLKQSLEESHSKMKRLEDELSKTPLDIEEVRKNNKTIVTLKKDLIVSSEQEIKRKLAIKSLIEYVNQYVVDDEIETLVDHISYLYNNADYGSALKELNNLISVFSGSPETYKKIVNAIEIESYADYAKDLN